MKRLRTLGVFGLLAAALAWPSGAFAAAKDNVSVSVDTEWPRDLVGGYFPIRVTVASAHSSACRVVVTAEGDSNNQSVRQVRRAVDVPAKAVSRFTLLWPVVDDGASGEVKVTVDGEPVDLKSPRFDLERHSSYYGYGGSSGSNVHANAVIVGPRELVTLANELSTKLSAGSSRYGSGSGSSRDNATLVSDPQQLPDSWLGYTALSAVILDVATLTGLAPEQRTPLVDWVAAGGMMIICDVPAAQAESVVKLFFSGDNPPQRIAQTGISRSAAGGDLVETTFDLAGYRLGLGGLFFAPKALKVLEATGTDGEALVERIKQESGDFRSQLGFTGTPESPSHSRYSYGGEDNKDKLAEFKPPGVGEPPVNAFLILMFAFTIVVGPVNYFLLHRKKKQYLMLVTVPLIALVTVGAIVLYALLFEGLGIKGQVATVSVLTGRGQAVTLTRQSMYAGWSPGVVRFEQNVAVFPVNPGQPRARQVDWTAEQALDGWAPARDDVQWVTLAVEPARQRLTVNKAGESSLTMTNNLGVRIRKLVLRTSDGAHAFEAENVADGQTVTLLAKRSQTEMDVVKQRDFCRVPLASRLGLLPGTFIAETDGPLFEHSGPKKIKQANAVHVVGGRYEVAK
ncbi:MAG: hypothetical protein PHU85_09390 [Phycisphaerae bacterium]|nr:hypothetical protein [Phycisphaerae bacterium]